jgi:cystathionine beta-lyase
MNTSAAFDKKIDRIGTNSYKYDLMVKYFGTNDALPMWVADMEFASPDFILEAIRERCDHGILGYTILPEGWSAAIVNWMRNHHGWEVSPKQLGFVPGIVSGLGLTIQCFTQPGDGILVQTPIYPPFMSLPEANDRKLVINRLLFKDDRFHIDFEAFEQQVSTCKLFLLCNPHNPGGRIWEMEELERMCEICNKLGVLIVSDEIHADLALPGHTHHCPGSFAPELSYNVITLMAPSKTFNIPGLSSSYYIIQNDALRKQFKQYLNGAELGNGSLFSIIAAQAAYEKGDAWLEELKTYLVGNIEYVDAFLKQHTPRIKACLPQASFLIWLDCRELHLDDDSVQQFFLKEAKLALNPGPSFGPGGEGFMRLNIGCPRSMVEQAMEQLKLAYQIRF